ncbi:MAG: TonB family protein [Acidobacteria bacterium]|nr:TonB family protein [Acidobacteriota bacterium]
MAEPPVTPDLDLLLHLDHREENRRLVSTASLSVILHIVFLGWLSTVQFEATPPRTILTEIQARRVTPLVVPPDVKDIFTQKAPNTRKPAKELDVQGLAAKEVTKAPPARAAISPKPKPGTPAPSLPDAPQIAAAAPTPSAQLPPPGIGNSNQPPPPQIEPVEKPKLTFERVTGAGMGSGSSKGAQSSPNVPIPLPKTSVADSMARVMKRPGGGLVVGQDLDPAPSIGESLGQKQAPPRMGSQLELLSDPQGADFRPYLLKVLAAVRRNWFAVIPESARYGRRGNVVIQFSISRNGGVPKLVIAIPSGAEPLDRAAVAGISASTPFPPLPDDFRGDTVRLQLSFVYNGQR